MTQNIVCRDKWWADWMTDDLELAVGKQILFAGEKRDCVEAVTRDLGVLEKPRS